MFRLALRDLWIGYRMLGALTLLLGAGGVVAAAPPELVGGLTAVGGSAAWLAIGLAAAVAASAAMAAGGLAAPRQRAMIAWLATRGLPRSAPLLGWFGAWALILGLGSALAAAVTWSTALDRVEVLPDPLPYLAAAFAAWCGSLACVAVALLLGTVAHRRLAGPLTLLVTGGWLAITLLDPTGPLGAAPQPMAGFAILISLDATPQPIGDAVIAAGAALVVTACVLVLAGTALERAEL